MLIFDSTQMMWQCICQSSTEMRPWHNDRPITAFEDQRFNYPNYAFQQTYEGGYRITYVGLDKLNYVRRLLHRYPHEPENAEAIQPSPIGHAMDWNSLVSDYSRRSLTYSTDVLFALSGLASAASTGYDCPYRAGLWEKYISNRLLWCVMDPQTTMTDENREDMPSWSWISQWGSKIEFLNWGEEHSWHARYEVKAKSSTKWMNSRMPNLFLWVGDKTLMLTGRMRTCKL